MLEIGTGHYTGLTLRTNHPQAIERSYDGEVLASLGSDILNQVFSLLATPIQHTQSQRDTHLIQKNQFIRVECCDLFQEGLVRLRVSFPGDAALF